MIASVMSCGQPRLASAVFSLSNVLSGKPTSVAHAGQSVAGVSSRLLRYAKAVWGSSEAELNSSGP
jgi:hypothetical protein